MVWFGGCVCVCGGQHNHERERCKGDCCCVCVTGCVGRPGCRRLPRTRWCQGQGDRKQLTRGGTTKQHVAAPNTQKLHWRFHYLQLASAAEFWYQSLPTERASERPARGEKVDVWGNHHKRSNVNTHREAASTHTVPQYTVSREFYSQRACSCRYYYLPTTPVRPPSAGRSEVRSVLHSTFHTHTPYLVGSAQQSAWLSNSHASADCGPYTRYACCARFSAPVAPASWRILVAEIGRQRENVGEKDDEWRGGGGGEERRRGGREWPCCYPLLTRGEYGTTTHISHKPSDRACHFITPLFIALSLCRCLLIPDHTSCCPPPPLVPSPPLTTATTCVHHPRGEKGEGEGDVGQGCEGWW